MQLYCVCSIILGYNASYASYARFRVARYPSRWLNLVWRSQNLLSASMKAEGRALKLKLCLQTVVKSISKVQEPHIKVTHLNITANDAAV